jgi:hypothetical protein
MCPVRPGFPSLLAPCLLGDRMLGPGWLVHFRRIGLDHQIGVPSDAVTERDNRRGRFAAGLASWSSFLVAMESGAACGRTSAPPEPAVLAGRESPRGADPGQGILDLGGQRLRPPRSIAGTRGVHFRPGQPVRGLAGVQWDTARSGLDGRRNPGRTVRRQTGLRADDGGLAQGRRAQNWASSLEDGEDRGLAGSFLQVSGLSTPAVSARIQHAPSEMNPGFGPTLCATGARHTDALQSADPRYICTLTCTYTYF